MTIRTIHPFPARMAPELALVSLRDLAPGSLVLDPMTGSGTVLRQAVELGHHAVGFDLDPLAVLMSRVWATPIDGDRILAMMDKVLSDAAKVDLRFCRLPWVDAETRDFMKFWFAPSQRRALQRISWVLAQRAAAGKKSELATFDALKIGLSRIIVTKAQGASLARDTSHSRPHRVAESSDYDVAAGFERSTRQLVQRLGGHRRDVRCSVANGDARSLPLPDSSIDAIVTSPPYLNAIDYMRGHKLSLVWLGYSLDGLREIRSTSVGTERAGTGSNCENAQAISRAMCEPGQLSPRQQRMVDRYAVDLKNLLHQASRVLKPGGHATYVVGNSCLNEIFIKNSEGVLRAAKLAGFQLVESRERDLPSGSRYLPLTKQGALSKRMRTESVMKFEA